MYYSTFSSNTLSNLGSFKKKKKHFSYILTMKIYIFVIPVKSRFWSPLRDRQPFSFRLLDTGKQIKSAQEKPLLLWSCLRGGGTSVPQWTPKKKLLWWAKTLFLFLVPWSSHVVLHLTGFQKQLNWGVGNMANSWRAHKNAEQKCQPSEASEGPYTQSWHQMRPYKRPGGSLSRMIDRGLILQNGKKKRLCPWDLRVAPKKVNGTFP